MKSVAAILLLFLLGAVSYVGWQAYDFLYAPPETPGRERIIFIEPGSTFDQVARALQKENLIKDADRFRMLGKWKERISSIKAGEFRLSTGWTPSQILDALTYGKPLLHKVRIPEGLTWWQTGSVIEESGLASFESFDAAVHERSLLREFHIPWDTAEGFLYPDTYYFTRPVNNNATALVRVMLGAFWEHAASRVWPDARPTEKELKKVLTLASMVEKETGVASERGRIAGVFSNRVKKRMLLQCDPTVIYGLGTAFDGNLRRPHLEDGKNPYNTYRLRGLPPGPVCSPGLESLLAAKNPERHNYLYFVSKGDGSHHFSATLKEHNRAVRKYQLKKR